MNTAGLVVVGWLCMEHVSRGNIDELRRPRHTKRGVITGAVYDTAAEGEGRERGGEAGRDCSWVTLGRGGYCAWRLDAVGACANFMRSL